MSNKSNAAKNVTITIISIVLIFFFIYNATMPATINTNNKDLKISFSKNDARSCLSAVTISLETFTASGFCCN